MAVSAQIPACLLSQSLKAMTSFTVLVDPHVRARWICATFGWFISSFPHRHTHLSDFSIWAIKEQSNCRHQYDQTLPGPLFSQFKYTPLCQIYTATWRVTFFASPICLADYGQTCRHPQSRKCITLQRRQMWIEPRSGATRKQNLVKFRRGFWDMLADRHRQLTNQCLRATVRLHAWGKLIPMNSLVWKRTSYKNPFWLFKDDSTIRYEMLFWRGTCAKKLTLVSLIYRTEPTTKKWGKTIKLKSNSE